MAMVSCRKAFTAKLLQNAKENADIFAVATDSRGSVTLGEFGKQLPDRLIEFGIAEQNAVAAAAGLAKTGKKVFVTGPACFLAARAYEQVKVDVAYNRTDVRIIGVSAGVSYGPLGCTHTTMHDFASMRALPNLTILAPCDAVQTEYLTDLLCQFTGPVYMRMGRGDVPPVYEAGEKFEIGKIKTVCEGTDATIIACGEMVAPAKKAAELLQAEGISVRVLDCFTIQPMDTKTVEKALRETRAVVTVEEHSTRGGLGEAVSHIAAELRGSAPMRLLGLPEEVVIGKSQELFAYYGLTPEGISAAIKERLERE